jgi:hypothetical protein
MQALERKGIEGLLMQLSSSNHQGTVQNKSESKLPIRSNNAFSSITIIFDIPRHSGRPRFVAYHPKLNSLLLLLMQIVRKVCAACLLLLLLLLLLLCMYSCVYSCVCVLLCVIHPSDRFIRQQWRQHVSLKVRACIIFSIRAAAKLSIPVAAPR